MESIDKFLDKNGVLYLWAKIKAAFVSKEAGKGLSTNDFTNEEKAKLAGISAGATNTTIDATLSETSGNPVQNKALTAALNGKVAKEEGKSLTTNDYTNADKTKLNAIEIGAQVNVLDKVSVNGVEQTITNKTVNISVPTTVAALTDAGEYAKKSDLTNVYKYQGSVPTFSDLPVTSTEGYVYNVESDNMNYAWNGTTWDPLGAIFSIDSITNEEIDAIVTA